MKETKMTSDDINNQPIVSKIDTDIVSMDREDKPLIFISNEAIYLKRDNDNLRKENNQYKEVLDKIKEFNKSILKERWYGGNEKDYAKKNLEILEELNE